MKHRGVEGGTPFGDPLCPTCRWFQEIKGQSLTQISMNCSYLSKPLKFRAYECSQYSDKRYPHVNDMTQIAWMLVTDVKTKKIGFMSAAEWRENHSSEPMIPPVKD